MLNSPTNVFRKPASRDGGAWDVDGNPNVRLFALFVLMVLPFVAILARVAYLQVVLPADLVATYEAVEENFEPIPARDGRILGADGRVLADDVLHINLSVHYRWLEDPPNKDWLRKQATANLPRAEHRNTVLVDAEKQKVLARRDELWRRLQKLSGLPKAKLDADRLAIQKRVERVVQSVNENQKKKAAARDADAKLETPTAGSWWEAAWNTAVSELTTPPARSNREPIEIKEVSWHYDLIDRVPLAIATEIEANPALYPGVKITTSTERVYPQGTLAPHIVGSRRLISVDELKARKAQFPDGDPLHYQDGDRIGKDGLEKSYDQYLRGVAGSRKVVTIKRGSRRGEVVETSIVREPRNGRDVELTLNMPLQERMERFLDKELARRAAAGEAKPDDLKRAGACIVAIDVRTGAVIAAVSAPRFDLDLMVHFDAARWKQTVSDPRNPLIDRATQMALPPGSVFKPISAIAILEDGSTPPDQPCDCQGFLDTPDRYRCLIYNRSKVGHGATTLSDALCKSCNVYFFQAARAMGGPEPIVQWAHMFGLGERTGVDLPHEQDGNLPIPDTMLANGQKGKPWYKGDTLQLSIGQSRLTVTPMQVGSPGTELEFAL